MKRKRIALAIALAAIISFCLSSVASQANMASVDPTARSSSCSHQLDTAAAPISPGAQCIPCSPKKPCVNPLTVCSYNGSSTHGCCLGYAGQN